ncbi:MAG: hypothetical protein CMH34_13490 [Microbacterium sp.]|nr:hypothetical protein [Microbacterium sp.]
MTDQQGGRATGRAPFDAIAADLQRLRIESGDVSYAEIATRIARRREADGASPASARIARSTVYDVFRPGRRRIKADLVGEIVTALGGDEDAAARWRRRCLDARADASSVATEADPRVAPAPTSDPDAATGTRQGREPDGGRSTGGMAGPVGDPVSAEPASHPRDPSSGAFPDSGRDDGLSAGARDATAWRSAGDDVGTRWRPSVQNRSVAVPSKGEQPGGGPGEGPSVATLRTSLMVAIMVGSVFLNLFGTTVHQALSLPLFLDMIGTATTAFVLGPWYGVVVGLATNALGAIVTSPETVVFGLVNATGAVLWGYGMRGFARTIPRFILLNVLVALACTLVAVPLNGFLYDGDGSGHATDAYVATLRAAQGMWLALFSVNFLASLADKMLAGFLALGLARLLTPLKLRDGDVLPLLQPRRGRRDA